MVTGAYLKIGIIKTIGWYIFVFCAVMFFLMWLISFAGLVGGRYNILEEKDWKDQIW